MDIIEKNVNELKPYEHNPRKNEDAIEYVCNSIKYFGFKVPIIVDKNNVIVAGHTRLEAAKRLGYKKVPCIVADDLTDEQIKTFRIADNKTAEKSSWDDVLLKEELNDVVDAFDMTDFGFGDFELTMLTEDFEPEPYDEELINEYGENESSLLAKARVIITYKHEQAKTVADLLGLDEIKKVIYDIEDILRIRREDGQSEK